jgi:hypothetical protein
VKNDKSKFNPQNNSTKLNSFSTIVKVENQSYHDILVHGLIFNKSGEVIDSTLFYDDRNHNDGTAEDKL